MKELKTKGQYKISDKLTEVRLNEILKVKKEQGLTATNLVNTAKSVKNPLHKLFDWDNDVAGDKWRLQQGRALINEVEIIIEGQTYPAFENVTIKIGNENSGREYLGRVEILNNVVLRKQFITSALEKVKYWKKQYECFNGLSVDEFGPIFSSIDKVDKKLK